MKVALGRLHDASAIARLAGRVYEDAETRRFTSASGVEGIAELVEMWLERASKGWEVYEVLADGASAGLAGAGPIEDGASALGLYLDLRGRGIGTLATVELLAHAGRRGATRARIVTHAGNAPARRIVERLGFGPPARYEADWAVGSGEPWLEFSFSFSEPTTKAQ